MKTIELHQKEVQTIADQIKEYSKNDNQKKLRFYHGGTNSTRPQENEKYTFIDISFLNQIIEINTEENYVVVEPNVPMDKLVHATLRYGLIPPVVMEFPGITIGGAVNGATLESSAYKYGQLNDNCTEYEVITGSGEIIRANTGQHTDLFYGISGAYGTLGLLTLIKMKLLPASKYVHVIYYPTHSYEETLTLLKQHIKREDVDYIEANIFAKDKGVVILGQRVDNGPWPIQTYSKSNDPWFYEQCERIATLNTKYEELVPIADYEFRYNRGAFWMGKYFFSYTHIPNWKIIKRLLNPVMNTRKLYDGLHETNLGQQYFIQDFYCPFEKALEFLTYSEKKLNIFPIWLCPLKPAKNAQKLSPDYIKADMLVDIGIWGQSDLFLKDILGINKEFEAYAKHLGARKMLYAHSFYTEDEFWKIHDKEWYLKLREKYNAQEVFPDIWQKVHVENKLYSVHFWRGAAKILLETLQGKHLNT